MNPLQKWYFTKNYWGHKNMHTMEKNSSYSWTISSSSKYIVHFVVIALEDTIKTSWRAVEKS